MPTIDNLNIQLQADAVKASDAITRFSNKIGTLASSLMQIEKINVSGVSTGINRLATAMQNMNNIRTADFSRLARNLTNIGSISTANLNTVASSLSHLTRSFNQLGSVTGNVTQISTLAQSLSRLGGANVQRAVTTIPQLEIALNNLLTTLSRANVNANVIALMNSISNLGNRSTAASTQINTLNGTLNNLNATTQRTSRSTFSLASAFGYLYASFFWVRRIIGGLNGSIESTADYLESFNYYTVALKKIAQEWDEDWESYGDEHAQAYSNKFITTLNDSLSKMSGIQINVETGILESTGIKNLGLNINEITQASAQLASITNSIGQTGEVSLATSSAFTKLASDMSSLYNMDYSAVMTNLQSGLIGQSRAMYKYGIDITNASLQTLAYELGVEKSVSEMGQMEKHQLRIIQILRGSKVAWGDQATTINSLANQMRLLENNGKEISIVFGQLFTPIMENLLPIVNGMAGAVKNLMTNIAVLLGVTRETSTAGQGQASEIEQEMLDAEDGTNKANEALKEYKNQMMGFDEAQKLNDTEANATLNTNLGDTIDLKEEILKATDEYEKFWEQAYRSMENKAEKWTKYFSGFFGTVKNIFKDIQLGDYLSLGKDVAGLADDFTKFITKAVNKVEWDDLGEFAGKFISGAISGAFETLPGIANFVMDASIGLTDFVINSIANIDRNDIQNSFLNSIGETLANVIMKLPTLIATSLGLNIDFGLNSEGVQSLLGDDVIPFKDSVNNFISSIGDMKTNFQIDMSNAEAEYGYLDTLADKYFNLASKAERTGEEENDLGKYRQALIDAYPEFAEILGDAKLSYEEQEQAIRNTIDALKEKARIEAVEQYIVEIDKKRLDLQRKIDSYDKSEIANAQVKRDEAKKVYEEYENTKRKIEELGKEREKAFNTPDHQRMSEIDDEIESLTSQSKNLITEYSGLIDSANVLDGSYQDMLDAMNDLNSEYDYYVDVAAGVIDIDADVKKANEETSGSFDDLATDAETASSKMQGAFALADWTNIGADIAKGVISGFDNNFKPPTTEWQERLYNSLFGKDGKLEFEFSFDTGTVEGFENFKNKWGIKAYAAGGFPEDGLFFANRGELVGKFSNGKTAVANNSQIIDGIRSGVYDAVTSAILATSENGGNVTVVLQGDADGLFKVVQNKANNYAIQTGQSPFLI